MTQLNYDDAIAYLTNHPAEISWAWMDSKGHPAGRLFAFATKDRSDGSGPRGCLTTIRQSYVLKYWNKKTAETEELTKAIVEDIRIPIHSMDIKVSDLPVFKEWQERLDKELERV